MVENDDKYIISLVGLLGSESNAEAELRSYTWDRMGEEADSRDYEEHYSSDLELFDFDTWYEEQNKKIDERK